MQPDTGFQERPAGNLGAAAALGMGFALLLWGPGLVLAAIGAGFYLVGASARPLAALAGVVAALPLYLFPREISGLAISPPEATLLLCALGAGIHALVARRRDGRHLGGGSAGPYDAPIALFLAAALLSLLITEYLRLSLRELRTLIVEPILFYYLARRVIRTTEEAAPLVDTLMAATTVVALIGIGQFFFGGAVTDVQGVRRIQGTYTSPNHFGLLLGRALPFLLAGAWLVPARRGIRGVAAALCVAALALTFSLGAWLGTGAAVVAVIVMVARRGPQGTIELRVWWPRGRPWRGLLAVVVVTALGFGALTVLPSERILGRLDLSQGTTVVRVQLWQAAAGLLREQPLLGIGLDNFLYRYSSYTAPGVVVEPNLSHPHNLILQFWLQLGLAGLVALVWLLAIFVARTWPRARPPTQPLERALAVGALASMVDFVVHGLVDNSYFLTDAAFIFWLTLAVGVLPAASLRLADRA